MEPCVLWASLLLAACSKVMAMPPILRPTTNGPVNTTPLDTTTPGQCVYENVTYPEGEFMPDGPCWPCLCRDGHVQCPIIIFDCIYGCADFVPLDDECCPVCPNGDNCMTPNGTILAMDQLMEMANGDICFCPNTFPGFFSIPRAICSPPNSTTSPDVLGTNGGGPNPPSTPNVPPTHGTHTTLSPADGGETNAGSA